MKALRWGAVVGVIAAVFYVLSPVLRGSGNVIVHGIGTVIGLLAHLFGFVVLTTAVVALIGGVFVGLWWWFYGRKARI